MCCLLGWTDSYFFFGAAFFTAFLAAFFAGAFLVAIVLFSLSMVRIEAATFILQLMNV